MLLTKEVELHWSNRIKKYYVEKGYEFTGKDQAFMCKIEDLQLTSAAIVEVNCDYCGKIHKKYYHQYITSKQSIGKDACINCAPLKTKEVCKIKYGKRDIRKERSYIGSKIANAKKQNDFMQKLLFIANNKGYLLFPFVYINSDQLIPYICSKHKDLGVQCSCAWDLSRNNNNCIGCINEEKSDRKLFSIDYVRKIIESNEKNKLLSTIYTGARDRNLKITCANCEKPYITNLNKYTRRNQIYCPECSNKINNSGENNCFWKGGVTSLNNFLRGVIKPWVKDSLESANYRCNISGENGYFAVHHLFKNFKDIVNETLEITNLDVRKNIGDYSQYEQELLAKTCLELHYKYGLGVCILNDYHLDFHSFYGNLNNTPEQYYQFKKEIQEELEEEQVI